MRVLDVLSVLAAAVSLARPVIGAAASCGTGVVGTAAAGDPYWLETIRHQGIAAFNSAPSSYRVFRNVKDYGAVGDGTADDTAAIK